MRLSYCSNCGEKLANAGGVCSRCGQPGDVNQRLPGVPAIGAGGVGWSSVTGNEPCFINNKNKIKKGLVVFGTILSIGIGIFVTITSGSPVAGLGVAAFIMVLNIICYIAGGRKKSDWEGSYDADNNPTINDVYKTVFRLNNGKQYTHKEFNSSKVYNYLQVGDMVRFHGTNMRYFEKYDKSRDAEIPCAGCMSLVDARANYCPSCGCIMLKGAAGGQMSYQQGFQQQPFVQQGQPFMQQGQAFAQPFVQAQTMGQQQQFAQPQTFAHLQCPSCGSLLYPGAKFCPGCGTQLQ